MAINIKHRFMSVQREEYELTSFWVLSRIAMLNGLCALQHCLTRQSDSVRDKKGGGRERGRGGRGREEGGRRREGEKGGRERKEGGREKEKWEGER